MRIKIELLSIIFIICTLNNCEGTNILSRRAVENYIKIIDNNNFENITLTIYYINPYILTRAPLTAEQLINFNKVNKIIISYNVLREHIDLIKQINVDVIVPVRQKSYLDARLCYVFETDRNGIILNIAMGGTNNSVFINGFEVEDNEVFYNVIRPFLTEEALTDLQVYFNRDNE